MSSFGLTDSLPIESGEVCALLVQAHPSRGIPLLALYSTSDANLHGRLGRVVWGTGRYFGPHDTPPAWGFEIYHLQALWDSDGQARFVEEQVRLWRWLQPWKVMAAKDWQTDSRSNREEDWLVNKAYMYVYRAAGSLVLPGAKKNPSCIRSKVKISQRPR